MTTPRLFDPDADDTRAVRHFRLVALGCGVAVGALVACFLVGVLGIFVGLETWCPRFFPR